MYKYMSYFEKIVINEEDYDLFPVILIIRYFIKRLFCKHDKLLILSSRRGIYKSYRKCINCGKEF